MSCSLGACAAVPPTFVPRGILVFLIIIQCQLLMFCVSCLMFWSISGFRLGISSPHKQQTVPRILRRALQCLHRVMSSDVVDVRFEQILAAVLLQLFWPCQGPPDDFLLRTIATRQTQCASCLLRNVKLSEKQRVRGLCQGRTRTAWVQVHPGRSHSFV